MGSAVAGRFNSGRLGAFIGAEASLWVVVDGPELCSMDSADMGGSADSDFGGMALALPLAAAASFFRAAMVSLRLGREEDVAVVLLGIDCAAVS